jgi:diaminohydroxyphosphoribosylaminopyrimidine deaminase/5-amino-6-(5-phosphoribosylamino)uracil reductase
VSDEYAALTTIVTTKLASKKRVAALAKRVSVIVAPSGKSGINLRWVLKKLGAENVTSLLVEGGGEVNASFLLGGLAHRITFFYAPKVLGGRDARKGVGGDGAKDLNEALHLQDIKWQKLGEDLLLTARIKKRKR